MVPDVFAHWFRGERWPVSFGSFNLVHARFTAEAMVIISRSSFWGCGYIYVFFGAICLASSFCYHATSFYRKTFAKSPKNIFGENYFAAHFFWCSSDTYVALAILWRHESFSSSHGFCLKYS